MINHWQIVGAVKLTNPTARIWTLVFTREAITTDVVVTCLASLVTFALTFTLAALVVALPVVFMQKRFLMHAQLLAEARTDAKTGLLNAATWHREASTELSRIRGTGRRPRWPSSTSTTSSWSTTPTGTWPATGCCGWWPTGSGASCGRAT